MKNLKFIRSLKPIEKQEYDSKYGAPYTYGFREEPVLVDAGAFLSACLDTVETRTNARDKPFRHTVVWVEFAKGDRLACFRITFSEFERFFGMPWPVEKIGSRSCPVIQ